MTLLELTTDLARFDSTHTIYAKEPWAPNSDAVAAAPDPDERLVPVELEAQGFRYFLEVSVAKEFSQGWQSTLKRPPIPMQLCERLIQYAVHDA